jgi:hypothetical protein
MKKNLIPLFVILLFSLLVSIPLIAPGLHQIHDDQQIARLFLFDKALLAGQFPVRWVDGLGFGFGYPLFVFYPPLVYMLGEAFHLIGFSFVDSVKLVFFVSIIASGVTAYVFAKELWGKTSGLVSAVFYILVPYRALDIYVRGALAESFSFVWLPAVLWSLYMQKKTAKETYTLISSILLALLMITHNLIFLPFSFILAAYVFYLVISSSDKINFTRSLIITGVLSAGLSAFFWIPALFEKAYTIVDNLLLVNLANYNIHFVYPQQLWNWTWGFGGSAEGLSDGISFKIGKLHVLVSLVGVIFAAVLLAKNKFSEKLPFVFFALFSFSAFMTTYFSKSVWDLVTPLQYLQFPWRFLTFTALFASLLAGYFIYTLKLPVVKMVFAAALISALAITNLKLFKPQQYRLSLTDQNATAADIINWDISFSSFEYVPKEVPLRTSDLKTNVIDIKKTDIPERIVDVEPEHAEIRFGNLKPHELSFTIDAKQSTNVTINIFNFPGWKATVDSKSVQISSKNKFKLISIDIPYGVHDVNIKFDDTRVRAVSNFITISSLIFVLTFFINKWRKVF